MWRYVILTGEEGYEILKFERKLKPKVQEPWMWSFWKGHKPLVSKYTLEERPLTV